MEKIVREGLLYDFYGQLLTRHQREVYEQVVYDDLSLTEIAEQTGVSKQAVHDLIRRTTAQMSGYEEKLGLIARFYRIRTAADELAKIADDLEQTGSPADSEDVPLKLRKLAERIKEDTT